MVITVASSGLFRAGDTLVIHGTTPRLPDWVTRRPWQDGDQELVRWFYKVVGWKLPTSFKATVSSVSRTELTLAARSY